jgi:hypothetical protein
MGDRNPVNKWAIAKIIKKSDRTSNQISMVRSLGWGFTEKYPDRFGDISE